MSFRNLLFLCSGLPLRSELREVAVNEFLQFVVKNDAEIPPTLPFYLFGCGVIHPIYVCIVVGFTRFGKAVVDGLISPNVLRYGQNETALPRQGKEAARTYVGMRNPLLSYQALADEVLHIRFCAVFVSLISEFL